MFEITGDDIALLNDSDLRALVGRLCEAEVRKRNLPTAAITWGGNQNAADGGIDVRVALPAETMIDGYISRAATGFQVKQDDMPKSSIIEEMHNKAGEVKPVIKELANQSGAYVIVSSKGSVADAPLAERRKAMREVAAKLSNGGNLDTDFYDRNRVATWLRDHPGLIPWVRERIGKKIQGWQSYGSWANGAEDPQAEYFLDDHVRVKTGQKDDGEGVSALKGLHAVRSKLQQPGSIVRLVGLSGVGKTRFVQALFDDRLGENSLDPHKACYTNMMDDPNPQPTGLASDLIATGARAILVVDNCPQDLHRRLMETCSTKASPVSVITIEYDIREDTPEGTSVFTLEASSSELIEKILRRRFPNLSQIDARTISENSGGNSRIAIALAGTVQENESIAGLKDDELFKRLFHQKNDPDNELLLAAQACSLVYSFDGENVSKDEKAELFRLGGMVGIEPDKVFRHVAELQGRELVQQRSVWRAVLPHAIANRLAKTALQRIPHAKIEEFLILGAPERLLKSFSRRLGYLHDSNEAQAITKKWLSNHGLLKDITDLNDLGKAIFKNVAPLSPEATLAAIERAISSSAPEIILQQGTFYARILRSLAYDAALFDRATAQMIEIIKVGSADDKPNEVAELFYSLFHLILSGTHAPIEQRLKVIKGLLEAPGLQTNMAARFALRAALEASHFSSSHGFEFGSRSRNYGYWPKTQAEVKHWFGLTLELCQELALEDGPRAKMAKDLLAEQFRGLWRRGDKDKLESVCLAIVKNGFWREGWRAVRMTQYYASTETPPEDTTRLEALEVQMRPKNLRERIQGVILQQRSIGMDMDDFDTTDIKTATERAEAQAFNIGKEAVEDPSLLKEILPDLFTDGGRLWSFGKGLAAASTSRRETWETLRRQLEVTPSTKRNIHVMQGYLDYIGANDSALTSQLLDEILADDTLGQFFPMFQKVVPIDATGIDRIIKAVALKKAPIGYFVDLSYGPALDKVPGPEYKRMILAIAAQPGGLDVAMEVMGMRLHFEKPGAIPAEIKEAGCEVISGLEFDEGKHRQDTDYKQGVIVKQCLTGDAGAAAAAEVCRKLMHFAQKNYSVYDHDDLLAALFEVQPKVMLNGLCGAGGASMEEGIRILGDTYRKSPLAFVPDDLLIEWCDEKPAERYPALASVITAFNEDDSPGPRGWKELALKFMEKAPDPIAVLKIFIERFMPVSWSGSQAALWESNLKLLDVIEGHANQQLAALAAQEKIRLQKIILQTRENETVRDRERDETFE